MRKRKPGEKSVFHGKGPFSSINLLTTTIGMIQHSGKVGVPFEPRTREEADFAEGVRNYHLLASNPEVFRREDD